jgi:hypothetical protein
MAITKYARASHNIAPLATVTVQSGVEDTLYLAANLTNLNPAKPAKITGTDGAWLFAFDTAVCLVLVAIIHHNFTTGTTTLRVQANTSDSWGSPPLDVEITIPADDADGYPRNPWVDLRDTLPDAEDRTYQYWRIVVADNDDETFIGIGEVVMTDEGLEFERNLQPGMGEEEEQPIVEHRTDHGVSTIYHLGPKWRTWKGELVLETPAAMAAFRALYQDAHGRALGFLLIPDPTGADCNDAWFVRFDSTKYASARVMRNLRRHEVGFEEVSRGLYL